MRNSILSHAAIGGQGIGLWADGLQTYAQSRPQNDVARIKTDRTGAIGGVDFGFGPFRAGVNGGYSRDNVQLLDRASSAKVKTTSAGASIGWAPAPTGYSVQVGGTNAWHDIDTARVVGITGLAGTPVSQYQARTSQLFAEAGHTAQYGDLRFNPFVRYAHVWTDVDGTTETGGPASLSTAAQKLETSFATAGLRISGTSALSPSTSLQPHANFDFTHAWGDRAGIVAAAFNGASTAFGVTAARIGTDTFGADIGVDVVSGNMRFGLAGIGSVSSEWNDYGAKASLPFRF